MKHMNRTKKLPNIQSALLVLVFILLLGPAVTLPALAADTVEETTAPTLDADGSPTSGASTGVDAGDNATAEARWQAIWPDLEKAAVDIGAYETEKTPPSPPDFFVDVHEADWFYDSVVSVFTTELMLGTSQTTFSPDDSFNRAMLTAVIWQIDGSPAADLDAEFIFTDLGQDWYAPSIIWASEHTIVVGVGNDLFAPYRPTSREEVVTMLYRYALLVELDVAVEDDANLNAFSDSHLVSSFARDPMNWAISVGLVDGRTDDYGNRFLAPQGVSTRAEVATMTYRFIAFLNGDDN